MTSVDELAEAFWERVGTPPPFPRDLECSVLMGFPLAIVKLPRLRTGAVDDWFSRRGRDHGTVGPDRPLRACLFALAGRGIVFVDAADPLAEQRFSLAHEVAHFAADYLFPREAVLERMGPAYAEILDGYRLPLPDERIEGLLAGVSLGVHRHLMDRGPSAAARVARSEDRADRLALELLAPRAAVRRALRRGGGRSVPRVSGILVDDFGLPPSVAHQYALTFAPERGTVPSLRSWLAGDVEVSGGRRNNSQRND